MSTGDRTGSDAAVALKLPDIVAGMHAVFERYEDALVENKAGVPGDASPLETPPSTAATTSTEGEKR